MIATGYYASCSKCDAKWEIPAIYIKKTQKILEDKLGADLYYEGWYIDEEKGKSLCPKCNSK